MKISEMEKVLNKIKKEKDDCELTDIIINDKNFSIYFENKKKESFIYTAEYKTLESEKEESSKINKRKIINKFLRNKLQIPNTNVTWGKYTDEEMLEINNRGAYWGKEGW